MVDLLPESLLKIRDNYKKELQQYRIHHNNYYNWYIHTLCIPIESLFFLVIIGLLLNILIDITTTRIIIMIITIMISIYYIIINCNHSIPSAIAYILIGYISLLLITYQSIWFYSIIIEMIVWFIQVVIGHYYLNKNNPSMSKSLSLSSIVLSLLLSWDSTHMEYDEKYTMVDCTFHVMTCHFNFKQNDDDDNENNE